MRHNRREMNRPRRLANRPHGEGNLHVDSPTVHTARGIVHVDSPTVRTARETVHLGSATVRALTAILAATGTVA